MRKAVSPRSMAQSPQRETFAVSQVSSSALGSSRGFKLPPLLTKGQIQPEQLANARFRLVEVDAQPLSDQQFNALIKRLVKCFMSEVEITKRLHKVASRRSVLPANKQVIRTMEALRRNYESERSGLVLQLSRDSRFRPYAAVTPETAKKASESKSFRSRKSKSLEIISKSSEVPEKTADPEACTSRQRQSGGFQPIICNRIATPPSLSKRLREKLHRLLEIAKYQRESSTSGEAMSPEETGSGAKSSSSDVFYDIENF